MAYMWTIDYSQPPANLVKDGGDALVDGAAADVRFADGVWEEHHALEDPGQAISPGGGVFVSGYPARIEFAPTMAQFIKDPKIIPSLFNSSGAHLVSDQVKEIVERFEPETHQFFPIKLYWKNGELAEERWVLNVCQRVDGVDKEASELWENRYPDGRLSTLAIDRKSKKLILSYANINPYHLWVDKHYRGSTVFLSDNLMAAFKEAGVTGGIFKKVKAV